MKLIAEENRKYNLTLAIFWVTTGLLLAHLIDQTVWLTVTGWVFTGYVVGNVGQKVLTK